MTGGVQVVHFTAGTRDFDLSIVKDYIFTVSQEAFLLFIRNFMGLSPCDQSSLEARSVVLCSGFVLVVSLTSSLPSRYWRVA